MEHHYSFKEENKDNEIQRRSKEAYAKHRDLFKSNIDICLNRQVYNSCVLPAMAYGAETWTLTKQAENKLSAAQTKMERSMVNITYKDRRTSWEWRAHDRLTMSRHDEVFAQPRDTTAVDDDVMF